MNGLGMFLFYPVGVSLDQAWQCALISWGNAYFSVSSESTLIQFKIFRMLLNIYSSSPVLLPSSHTIILHTIILQNQMKN